MLRAASLRSVRRCWLLGLFLWPAAAGAQQQLATLQGTITDQTGAIVPGVTVTATSVDTGVARTAITNDAGVYRLPSLEPGRYRVSAELTGFNRAIRDNVTLEVGATVGLPFVLQAGKVSEEVEVRGEAAVVQTERADISSVVERKRIEGLPLVSRNPLALTALKPGVTGIPTRNDFLQPEQGLGISASGMRGGANSAYVDGMSINANPHAGTVLIVPNVEAVEEFQVITNNPSAEHGRNIGASVNLVTRRGTNLFSGSAFQFYRNEALRSKNVFETEKPDFKRNNFGFSLGGPVRRDRAFFFGSYEGIARTDGSAARCTSSRPSSSAISSCRPVRTRSPRSCCGNSIPARIPRPGCGIWAVPHLARICSDRRTEFPMSARSAWPFQALATAISSTADTIRCSAPAKTICEPPTTCRTSRPGSTISAKPSIARIPIASSSSRQAIHACFRTARSTSSRFGYVRMHGEAADPTPQVPTISITGLNTRPASASCQLAAHRIHAELLSDQGHADGDPRPAQPPPRRRSAR